MELNVVGEAAKPCETVATLCQLHEKFQNGVSFARNTINSPRLEGFAGIHIQFKKGINLYQSMEDIAK